MEIFATGDSFGVGMMRLGNWEPKWDKKTGALKIVGERQYPISVTTNRGIFLECVDDDGKVILDGGDGGWFYVPAGREPVLLRYKTLPDPELTKKELDKCRRPITIHVADQERHDSGPFNFGASYTDGSLTEVLGSLEKIRDLIPEEYRAKARCEIDSNSGYEGSHYAHIEVSYERPETDEEVIVRVKIERERERLQRAADEAQLQKLQRKLAR